MNSFFPITRRLVELPDAELPATLWPRIAAAYAARRRLRRGASPMSRRQTAASQLSDEVVAVLF